LAAPTPVRIYVTIEGLQYDEAPGALYNVFLQGAAGRREQIGVINYFNLVPARSGEHASHTGHARTSGSFRFDVTDALKQLDISVDAQLSLIFEPTTGLTGSSAETVASQINPEANVRFESARLESSP
jgi:hypothetical protein